MPSEVVSELTYSLVYRPNLDGKRRLPLPFRWRSKEEIDFTLVVWPTAAGTCIRVFPPAPWAKFWEEIEAMPKDQKAELKRMVGSSSTTIKLDSAGRLTIPEVMAEDAGITNQAVLVGMVDRFEIWSQARYPEVKAQGMASWKQILGNMGA